MKKQLFTFVMMIALVIVTGSAMGQTSINPFKSATYTYTVGGIDAGLTTRKARIYYTTAAAPGTQIKIGTTASISIGTTITNPLAVDNTTGVLAGSAWDITLPIGATSVTFDATYGSAVATEASRIWIEIYNDAAGATCNNTMFLNVTPSANTLDFSILAANGTASDTKCPATVTPLNEKTDAVTNTTTIVYTIARAGGNINYDWSFKLGMTPSTFGPASENVTVVYTVASGSIVNGSGFGSDIKVRGVNSVTATVTVTNNPGVNNTDFIGALTNMTQFVNQTNVINSNADLAGNNSATTTLKEIPSIGNFSGN